MPLFFMLSTTCSVSVVFAQTGATKLADLERCLSRVKVPEQANLIEGEYSLYVGTWPAINLCQVLIVKGKDLQGKVQVIYAYEAGQYPAGSVNTEASFSKKKVTFNLPWKNNPRLTYDLSNGQASFQDKTGTFLGTVILQVGVGLIPFEVSP